MNHIKKLKNSIKIVRGESDKIEKEFLSSINIINPLKKEIISIDKEIDKIVYELYDLTDTEIILLKIYDY